MAKRSEPVWNGPEVDGITQSLLNRFIVCRERFRLLVVEGLTTAPTFNHRLEYGNMWHICEEEYARTRGKGDDWQRALKEYASGLCRRYPTQQEQVQKWYYVCRTQFPVYIWYWKKHKDEVERKPLLQEAVFDVPYPLPSGKVVRLRGKWDNVDQIGKGKNATIYLGETKTKGDIDEVQIKRQLRFDLQTMFYLTALTRCDGMKYVNVSGVRYNVIRRPLSGGIDSIRQHQPSKSNPQGETQEQFYARLGERIREKPEQYFMRWQSEVSKQDLLLFQSRCLNPLLENLYDWWEWIKNTVDPFACQDSIVGPPQTGPHWQTPYGLYNVLAEGGSTEVDEYLESGSELGLERTTELFSELT